MRVSGCKLQVLGFEGLHRVSVSKGAGLRQSPLRPQVPRLEIRRAWGLVFDKRFSFLTTQLSGLGLQ